MEWQDIRARFPDQWLLVEALEAHSAHGFRIMDKMAVVATYVDSKTAFQDYRQLHLAQPGREMFIVHTDREQLTIKERFWAGVRG